ncbi:DUF547 domain-containing protein [Membranihabitans maritimus]|uniref:DUF547 domain-containing protein n=1 Tax=Membranihabitans maritimus TaxID=2904244 RepID=UPI001F173C3D|nr:DUF547 domain-containing protein [Membranihabitans maritimus]
MKNLIIICSVFMIFSCKVSKYKGDSKPVSHKIWDTLLQSHVDGEGFVDYKGFISDSSKLNQYLELLSRNHPNDKYWSDNDQLAYWINAYNAFTIKLIVDNYPVQSIKDIKPGVSFVNSVWDIKFITIEKRTYDLNNIEHGIIRKQFDEPRIHFAVNCASISCPSLSPYAYTAENLNAQLSSAAKTFINNNSKNNIAENNIEISSIFKWFSGDFTREGTIIEFLNKYSNKNIDPEAKISYKAYNWDLNER